MGSRIHSISLPDDQERWLDENPQASLSKIIQSAIQSLMESSKISEERIKEEIRKRENFQKLSQEAREFIEKQGLLDEWLKEKGYL